MRRLAFGLITLAVLGAMNWLALDREEILRRGAVILLKLDHSDRRSVLQGDYMRLRFELVREILARNASLPRRGKLVVRLDGNGVATFVRLEDGTPLAPNERWLKFRGSGTRPRVCPESYFFEEGKADVYEAAEYAELRVDESGTAILSGLRNGRFERLGP